MSIGFSPYLDIFTILIFKGKKEVIQINSEMNRPGFRGDPTL